MASAGEVSQQPTQQGGGGHRGVERIAGILEAAAASSRGVRLIDVATMLDAPSSSIHSLLKALTSVGYLEESDGRYVVGTGLHALLAPHQTSWLVKLARDEVMKLSRRTGETAVLGIGIGDTIVYTFQVVGTESIHYTAKIGESRPLYPTSIGKNILAGMDEASVRAFLRRHPNLDANQVKAELEQIRLDGVAYNREETVKGLVGVSAAIHRPDGTTLAAMSVVGPVYRMVHALPVMSQQVKAAAAKVTDLVSTSPYGTDAGK
jgi:DNA-binding IclR family transcriptional regulator